MKFSIIVISVGENTMSIDVLAETKVLFWTPYTRHVYHLTRLDGIYSDFMIPLCAYSGSKGD